MKAWKKDLYLSLALLVICAVSYFYCETLPLGLQKFALARAGSYVQFWLIILFALSAMLLIRTLKRKPQDYVPSAWNKLVFLTLIILIAYLFVMPYIGFSIATCLFIFGLVAVYNQANTEKRHSGKKLKIALLKWLLFSVGFTAILFVLFTEVLKVTLPALDILGI